MFSSVPLRTCYLWKWDRSANFLALAAHHTPKFTSCSCTSYIILGLYVEKYLLFSAFAWTVTSNHAYFIKWATKNSTLTLHIALQNQLQNCTIATRSASWICCISVNVYGFRWSNFVSACINDFDLPVSCDNQHHYFHGDASYRAVSSNVSYERTRRVFCGFFQTIDPLFDIHLLFDVMLFSKGLKHWETVF